MNETMTRLYDGVGRVSQTQFTSDPDGITYTDTTYDAFGRVVANSNPYRLTSDKTYGITTTQYDALGRVTQVAPPDGTVPTSGSSCLAKNVCTSYSGNTTTVSDQTGNARKTQTDGLGRLTTVWEDPSGLNYQTLYQYSSLGNLTCVEQHGSAATGTGCSAPPSSDATSPWRIRRFAYDSLSRLSSAKIPESGTINYSYDADGNVLTRTTPSPNQPQTGTATVTATSTYDVLNRLKGKSFTDGYAPNPATPSLSYGYDGNAPSGCTPPAITGPTNLVGRRSSMCDGSGASAWSYDSMGRIYTETRTLNSVTNTFNYRYYLDGELAHLYYPSANHADYQVTSAGRSWGVSGPGGAYIPFNTKYAPQGAVSSMWMGANYTNGQIYSNFYYSNRLQPQVGYARQFVNGVAGPLLYGYCYDFHLGVSGTFGDGNVTCSVTASALGDNGNVYKVANQVNNSRTQNFAYDTLNRITQGYTTGGSWGETFTIDAWGNLTNRGLVAGKSTYEPLNAAPATVKNQLTGFGYDPAGNMTSNGSASYIYDAENRLAATAGWTYVYDGDGERVIKCNGTYPTCTAGTLYWGGAGTDALAESSLTGTMSAEYLFYLGKRMARNDLPGNTAHYYLQDHLGSARVTTDAAGALEKQTDYSPYGGEIWTSGTNTNHYKFTGKERDAESGLDDFGDRYHASTLGRWMSPDAINATAERVLNPSNTMNKYIYGANNPLKYLDPDGKDIIVFYDHGLPAGHFIVAAYDQDTGEFAIKSFGPKNDHDSGAMAKEAIGITVPGKEMYGLDNLKSADDLRKDYSSLTIQTSPEIAQQAIEFIRSNPSGDYNTYSNNCTTTCAKVLNDIKLINFGGNWGLRPLVLWQRVYELYGNYGKEWNNGSLERPLAPNTNGTEYGHPRVGFNSFEWLYRKAKCNAWITTDKSGGGRETLCAD